jgi:DNA invertase Pin-like site-specific DNA recombinase
MFLAMAEAESKRKSERAMVGALGRARNGKVTPCVPFGYRVGDEGKAIVFEAEATTVRRIFSEYLTGRNKTEIVDGLNDDGIVTPQGRAWYPRYLLHILKRTEYAGWGYFNRFHYDKRPDGTTRKIAISPEKWIRIEYPIIVQPAEWRVVQSKIELNAGSHDRTNSTLNFPLKRLIWCANCETTYIDQIGKNQRKLRRADGSEHTYVYPKPQRKYSCSKGRSYTKHTGCPKPTIGAKKIESIVWELVSDYLKHTERIHAIIAERRRQYEETGTMDALDKLRSRISEVEEERARALTMFQKGYINDAELDLRMRSITERIEMYAADLEMLEGQTLDYKRQIALLDDFVARTSDIATRLDTMSEDERTEVIRDTVSRIVIHPDVIEVQLMLWGVKAGEVACHMA